MEDFLPLITDPVFAATVLGLIVPRLYKLLSLVNINLPKRAKVLANLGLSALVAFIPLVAVWSVNGMPDPEVFWASIAGAFAASEVMYLTYFKNKFSPEE